MRFTTTLVPEDDLEVFKGNDKIGVDSESVSCNNYHHSNNSSLLSLNSVGAENFSSSENLASIKFLEPPPQIKPKKFKRKKKKQDKRDAGKSKRASIKTIDTIPDSIPEENSSDVMSSDPDIETVEYVKALERENQHTVHSVHQIFAELDELVQEQGEDVWEEKARWIKFEQDIHRGADKWGKPHVATLKLQSIINLRKCIARGTVLLGMKAFDLESVVEMMLDRLVSRALITSDIALQLRALLLKRHVHTGEHQDLYKFKYHWKHRSNNNGKHRGFLSRISESLSPSSSPPTSRIVSRANSEQDIKIKQQFLRKLPPDTEASNVMIGKLECLEVPLCVVIRLSHSILLGDVTEVPIPTRFIFLLLCPARSKIDHVEVGRAASALFADEMFYKIAYTARSKASLIQGLDRFLEKAIVIPPGEWDPRMKITLPEPEVSDDDVSDKEDEVHTLIEDVDTPHKRPFEGIQKDLESLRARWKKDWKRGIRTVTLLAPIQFSIVVLSYILFLVSYSFTSVSITPFIALLSVGVYMVLGSVIFSQPLLIISISLPVVLWEMAVSAICSIITVDYSYCRSLMGVVAGGLLILYAVCNLGNIFSFITTFGFQIYVVAIPFTIGVVIIILLHKISLLGSEMLLCYLILLLSTLIFLKLWHGLTSSTILTQKIRRRVLVLDSVIVICICGALINLIPLTTQGYETNQDLPAIFFASDMSTVVSGVISGVGLSALIVLQYGVVFKWVIKSEHKLRRIQGRYWDMLVVGLGVIMSGVYRMPMVIPDPFLTTLFLHVISSNANKSKDIIFVKEQRVSQLLSGIVVIIPAFILSQLHWFIPLPLCWGVILFYGGICISNTNLYERFKILFQAEKYHPEAHYVTSTPSKIINTYTVIQIILVVVLVGILCTPYTPVTLPLFVAMVTIIRYYLLPFVIYEDSLVSLEDINISPDPILPSSSTPSLASPDKEFSEEVSRISNGNYAVRDNDTDKMFPQIIFDNLTEEEIVRMPDKPSDNSDESPIPDTYQTVKIEYNSERRKSSLDFLATAESNLLTSLPFEPTTEEPIKSENPYAPSTFLDDFP